MPAAKPPKESFHGPNRPQRAPAPGRAAYVKEISGLQQVLSAVGFSSSLAPLTGVESMGHRMNGFRWW